MKKIIYTIVTVLVMMLSLTSCTDKKTLNEQLYLFDMSSTTSINTNNFLSYRNYMIEINDDIIVLKSNNSVSVHYVKDSDKRNAEFYEGSLGSAKVKMIKDEIEKVAFSNIDVESMNIDEKENKISYINRYNDSVFNINIEYDGDREVSTLRIEKNSNSEEEIEVIEITMLDY